MWGGTISAATGGRSCLGDSSRCTAIGSAGRSRSGKLQEPSSRVNEFPWQFKSVRLFNLFHASPARAHHAIILRLLSPHGFQERDSNFLITSMPAAAGSQLLPATASTAADSGLDIEAAVQFVARRIPAHLRAVHWMELLGPRLRELREQLVLPCGVTSMLPVLSKMESPDLIHCYILWGDGDSIHAHRAATSLMRVEQTLLWELPRFGLELRQVGGRMLSQNYMGYRLSQCQQLVGSAASTPAEDGGDSAHLCWYTLPEFQQYLVLERGEGLCSHNSSCARLPDLRVLVPVGEVYHVEASPTGIGGGGLVRVQIPETCDAELKVSRADIQINSIDLGHALSVPVWDIF